MRTEIIYMIPDILDNDGRNLEFNFIEEERYKLFFEKQDYKTHDYFGL